MILHTAPLHQHQEMSWSTNANCSCHCGCVHCRSCLASRSYREDGIGVGNRGAPGQSAKKAETRSLDNASAAVLSLPGMCSALCEKLKYASKKNRHLNRCSRCGSQTRPELSTCTTDRLSEMNMTALPDQQRPQMAAPVTTGSISLTAILDDFQAP